MTKGEFVTKWGWDKNARCNKDAFRIDLNILLKQAKINALNELYNNLDGYDEKEIIGKKVVNIIEEQIKELNKETA